MRTVRTHYLRWDEKNNEEPLNIFIMGYRDVHYIMDEKYYRSYDVEFDESYTLEDVYSLLSQDERHNRAYERSMCIGDVIEFDGELHAVEVFGFTKLMRVA